MAVETQKGEEAAAGLAVVEEDSVEVVGEV